jgi:dTDP-glucose 4,6-dehydratase/UDP-glucuronate decarboxylase
MEMSYDLSVIQEDCKNLFKKEIQNLENLKDKTVLITGANGLIGGFISDFLCFLNDVYKFNIDVQLTSLSKKEDATRITHLVNRSDVNYFSWDFAEEIPTTLLKPLDYVFFASGYAQPKKFVANKINTSLLNTIGLNSLLKYCCDTDTSFLYTSSGEIYGSPDNKNIPTNESYNGNYSVESNRACYISAKRMAEVLCLGYADENPNLNVAIARVSLVYGPGVMYDDVRVLQDFIMKGVSENQIKILDDGSSIRNCMYITDCVEVMFNILLNGKSIIYNVGGDSEEVTIFDMATFVGEALGVPVVKGNMKTIANVDAPNKVALDMTKFKDEFKDYNASVDLRRGIENILKWYGYG